MNELVKTNVENLIYEIRGKQVMLDSDLARLYHCKNGTKTINQAVKRNMEKFPEDFMFQLTKDEYVNLKSQFGTSSLKEYGGVRKMPYAFTEQGCAMLATVIHTEVAAQISVAIMRAFVAMKKYMELNYNYNQMVLEHNTKLIEHDKKFEELFSKFKTEPINKIFFNGEHYDSYSFILDILSKAKKEIIIIDNYADKKVLDIISKLDIKVILVRNDNIRKDILDKYNKQYNNLEIIINNNFHDRFIILDRKELYHLGTSLKDIGSKTFGINRIDDLDILNSVLDKI